MRADQLLRANKARSEIGDLNRKVIVRDRVKDSGLPGSGLSPIHSSNMRLGDQATKQSKYPPAISTIRIDVPVAQCPPHIGGNYDRHEDAINRVLAWDG